MSETAPLLAADTPRRRAVRPRHAASLIILRQEAGDVSMLMGMRGARHKFMPNRLVFPGGRVDRADWRARFATPLRPEVRMRLEEASDPRLAHALAMAAARELEEETGLTLGTPPHLHGLDLLCRAVTPPDNPIRFDARFLVVEEHHVAGTLAGSGELEGLRFFGMAEALALDLALITRKVLEILQAWLALPEPERSGRNQTPLFRNRKLVG